MLLGSSKIVSIPSARDLLRDDSPISDSIS